MVRKVPVPGTESIHFHPCVTMSNQQPVEAVSDLSVYSCFPVHQVPFFMQVHHINSAFVEVSQAFG